MFGPSTNEDEELQRWLEEQAREADFSQPQAMPQPMPAPQRPAQAPVQPAPQELPADPLGLTPEDDLPALAQYIAEQQQSQEPAFEPLQDHPASHADPSRPELPEQRPPDDWQSPGPSPLLTRATQRQAPAQAAQSAPQAAPAPQRSGFGMDAGMTVGALLDVVLNRGRNAGAILASMAQGQDPYQQQKRALDLKHRQAQINALNRPRGVDPMALELRRQALELRRQRLGLGVSREARLSDTHARRFDPAEADRMRQFYIDNGVPPEVVNGMSDEQLKRGASILNERAKQSPGMVEGASHLAGSKARAAAQYAMDPKVETARRSAEAVIDPKVEAARRTKEETAAIADRYNEEEAQRQLRKGREQEATKHKVLFAKADADMSVLESKLDNLIASKGADYKLPTQGNMFQQFWRTTDKKIFGGSGMDWEDTDLVASIQGSALPDYIVVANNAPNTEPERETAFMKWFSDGTLGGMKRFLQNQRAQNRARLKAVQDVLGAEGGQSQVTGQRATPQSAPEIRRADQNPRPGRESIVAGDPPPSRAARPRSAPIIVDPDDDEWEDIE